MAQLTELKQTSAAHAEKAFQEKHRELLKFLHSAARNKFLDRSASVLLQPFRGFVSLWMQVFQQCSTNPDKRPFILCSANKMQRASSVAGLAKVIGQEAHSNQPLLAGPDMTAAISLHKEIMRGKQ